MVLIVVFHQFVSACSYLAALLNPIFPGLQMAVPPVPTKPVPHKLLKHLPIFPSCNTTQFLPL